MALRVVKDEKEEGILSVELNNGDYKVLHEIVKNWNFKNRESALRFALALLDDTRNGTICKKHADGTYTLLVPTEEMLGE